MPKDFIHRTTCRICDSTDLVRILDLGKTPLANAYLSKDQLSQPEKRFPLAAYCCKNCTLVQVLDVVNPSLLFKNYHYITAANKPSVDHFKAYAEMIAQRFITSPNNLIIDIGGNDGSLLSYFKDRARVLNIDPADNLMPLSEGRGVPLLPIFFTSEASKDVLAKYGPARVVTANNITAHTDPIRDVYAGIATLIGDDGVFVAESHWVKNLIQDVAFDQIYHEHLCFYSLHALVRLAQSAGFTIFDVEVVPMQGESLRIFCAKNRPIQPSVQKILDEEVKAGLTDVETYLGFSKKVEDGKKALKKLLHELKKSGKRIVGYGAAAKGNTLLNYYQIGPDTLEYLVDSTPMKQGLYSPGMRIPIVSPEQLKIDLPDYILLLVWNYADAILKNEQALRDKGVKFIITVPELRVV